MVQEIKISEILRKADISLSECNIPRAERYLLKAKAIVESPFLISPTLFREEAEKNIDLYINVNRSLARIYIETKSHEKLSVLFDELNKIFLEFDDKVIREKFIALVTYIHGIEHTLKKSYTEAISFFETSLKASIKANDDDGKIYATWGLAVSNYEQQNFDESLKYIDDLQNLVKNAKLIVTDSFEAAAFIIKAHIAARKNEFEKALATYWVAHKVLRRSKNWYLHYYVLLGVGNTYKTMGDEVRAALYYDAILRSIEPTQLNQLRNIVQSAMNSLARDVGGASWRGKINGAGKSSASADRRFLPFELLYILTKTPGKVFSKEELAQIMFEGEIYNSENHDSKIIENVNRVRKLVEADENRPRYILSEREGFMFTGRPSYSMFDSLTEYSI